MKSLLILALFATPCLAREVAINRPIDLDRLERDLKAANYNVLYSMCRDGKCVLSLADAEAKDPSAIIAAVPNAKSLSEMRDARQLLISEMGTLEDKLDAGTATLADLRRIMKIKLKLSGLSKDGI